MAASTTEISRMFSTHRLLPGRKTILCVVYIPLGLVLAILRVFLGAHIFIVSCVLPKTSLVRRFASLVTPRLVLRFMSLLLGIVISTQGMEKRDKSAKVFVANHVSVLDHVALDLVVPLVTPSVWRLSSFLTWAMGYADFNARAGREAILRKSKEHCAKSKQPILAFPEGAMTNGQVGLLKFSTWSFSIEPVVQPVVVSVSRPVIPVSVETIGGSLITDLLWFLFVPFSVFTFRFLPSQKQKEDESSEEFARRVQELMAKELKIEATPFTNADKTEYVKRYLHRPPQIQVPNETPPANRPVPPTPPPSPATPTEGATNDHMLELAKMVCQVQEVLPHIAENIIRNDLKQTSCVDTTITNILEERVDSTSTTDSEFSSGFPSSSSSAAQTPTEPDGATGGPAQSPTAIQFKSPTFGKTSSTRQMSYQERKAALLESARRHYMEKHGMT